MSDTVFVSEIFQYQVQFAVAIRTHRSTCPSVGRIIHTVLGLTIFISRSLAYACSQR
jgi:hypothetical protein